MNILIWTGLLALQAVNALRWNLTPPQGEYKLAKAARNFMCPTSSSPNAQTVKVPADLVIYGIHDGVGKQQDKNCDNIFYTGTTTSCVIVYTPPAGRFPAAITAIKTRFKYTTLVPDYYINPDIVSVLVSKIEPPFPAQDADPVDQ